MPISFIDLPPTASGNDSHIQFMRLTAVNTWPAYNQRNANLSAYFRKPDTTYSECLLSSSGLLENTFNLFATTNSYAFWGDRDGGTVNQRDTKWDIAAGVSRIFEFNATANNGTPMQVENFDGVRFGFSLQLRSLGTPIFIEGRVRVELISGAGSILVSQEYYANDPAWFQGYRAPPNTGDPFDFAI